MWETDDVTDVCVGVGVSWLMCHVFFGVCCQYLIDVSGVS